MARSETEHFSSDLSESKAAGKKGCSVCGAVASLRAFSSVFACLCIFSSTNKYGSRASLVAEAVCYHGLEFTSEGRCYTANHNQNKNAHQIPPCVCSQVGIASHRAVSHSWKQRKEEARPAHACTICWQHLHGQTFLEGIL